MESTEGAGTERAQWVKRGDDRMGILEEEAARWRQGENGAQGAVEGFDLKLAVAWERGRTFEGEGEERGRSQIIGVREGDGGFSRWRRRLAQERDYGAGGGDRDR
jgi:hypothetical protein